MPECLYKRTLQEMVPSPHLQVLQSYQLHFMFILQSINPSFESQHSNIKYSNAIIFTVGEPLTNEEKNENAMGVL